MDTSLQQLVEEVFADPTTAGLDEMLVQLHGRRRDPAVAELIDDLLDHRFALAGGAGVTAA